MLKKFCQKKGNNQHATLCMLSDYDIPSRVLNMK